MEDKHIQMKGIPQETKSLIDEVMTHCEAIAEFSDNALDAGANNFSVELSENGCLTMKDDGCGIKDLEKYAQKFRVDGLTKDGTGKIGHFRKGSKYGAIKLSDFNDFCAVHIYSSDNGENPQKLYWPFQPNMMSFEDVYLSEDKYNKEKGTTVQITKSTVTNSILGRYKAFVNRTYAYKIKFKNFCVSVKSQGKTETIVDATENLFLENLIGENGEHQERLYENGIHYHKKTDKDGKTYIDVFYVVRVNLVKDIRTNKLYKVPFILGYLCADFDVEKTAHKVPFDIMYNEKYLSNEHTYTSTHLPDPLNRGGSWRIRPLLILDENTLEIFGGISNKSKPIPSLCKNNELKNLEIVINKGWKETIKKFYTDTKTGKPLNIVQVLQKQYDWLVAFNHWRSDNYPYEENFYFDNEAQTLLEKKILSCEENAYSIRFEKKIEHFDEHESYFKLPDEVREIANYIADELFSNKVGKEKVHTSIKDAISRFVKAHEASITDVA